MTALNAPPQSARTHPKRLPRALPRALHPLAWWLWALGLATAASRTTNPLILLLILATLAVVVSARRTEAPWARAFKYYLALGIAVIFTRVFFRAIFATGVAPSDHVLLQLPQLHTPSWYAGITIGGPVSLEAVLSASFDGLRLATLMCAIGAANTLANPKRALRLLPGSLYELGMAVTVAISFAPQLIESALRVRRARALRGDEARGLRAARAVLVPVLHESLERALLLAAAMDSRGYGRAGTAARATRRVSAMLMLGGLVGLCAGSYGLLDATAPRWLGVPVLLGGVIVCAAGMVIGSRRDTRTAYRPDVWGWPEWVVAGCGAAAAALMFLTARLDASNLNPSLSPLSWPQLPPVALLAVVVALVPAFAAPPPLRAGARA